MKILLISLGIYAFIDMCSSILSLSDRKVYYKRLNNITNTTEGNKELLAIGTFIDTYNQSDKLSTNIQLQQKLQERINILNKIKNNILLSEKDKQHLYDLKIELKRTLKKLMKLDIFRLIINVAILLAIIFL